MKSFFHYAFRITNYALSIALCAVLFAGCAQIKFDLTITDTGAVLRKWSFMGTAAFSQHIENIKLENEKLFPNMRTKTIAEGDMHGYEFSVEYPDIESFAQAASAHYAVSNGKNQGISRHKSWFFDEYDFDFYVTEPTPNIPIGTTINQTMFSQVVHESIIRLPYSVEKTNADEITDGGKVLKWDLAPLTLYGGEKYMQARFKIWHKDKIALTVAIEILLLAATIFFLIKARAETSETSTKDLRFKRNVFGGLFIALGIISAYLLLAPVVFNEADIISLTTK